MATTTLTEIELKSEFVAETNNEFVTLQDAATTSSNNMKPDINIIILDDTDEDQRSVRQTGAIIVSTLIYTQTGSGINNLYVR